jgi:transcriptional regulator GlxA family with amidase domain
MFEQTKVDIFQDAPAMKVGILAFPRVQLLDVAGPADVFAEAARQLGRPHAYRVSVVATTSGLLKTSCGLSLGVDAVVGSRMPRFDTLLVAGGPPADAIARDAVVMAWLQAQAGQVRRIGSVCSGAFVLAEAGLLEGKRATTHWNSAGSLARNYPGTQVDSDAIYIRDGNVYTSAGVTAGMDLALSLVEEDHGRALALAVARELVMFLKRPGGQSQFSAHLAAQVSDKSVVRDVQDYILENLGADLAAPTLAERARMSERNLARLFATEVGMTTAKFVEKARLEAARRALESADVPLKRLADTLGYASVDSFRRAFVRSLGTTPAGYRKRFSP